MTVPPFPDAARDRGRPRGLGRDVAVLPIALAKDLEFDEVIVPGATAQGYGAAGDRSLLHIACTRAPHRLALTYSGEPSSHLSVGVGALRT